MTIQWFPGHMNKARREVTKQMSKVDMVIEVLDARLPLSSINPLIHQLRSSKQVLKILNKSDLADDQVTQAWVTYFKQQADTQVMVMSVHNRTTLLKELPQICQALVPHRRGVEKPVRAMILGVPNVGKSTLLNNLLQRKIAKVADTPGVTKSQQRVELANGMILYDTPGLMWPKIKNALSGLRLALSGAIGVNAYDIEEVAYFALEVLQKYYPVHLKARYALSDIAATPEMLLEQIGQQRGTVLKGKKIDYIRISQMIVHDFRQGEIGKISLERPTDVE